MKMKVVAIACAFAVAFVFAMPAQAATMSECAAQWKALKAAKKTEGKTYKEFSKACMGGDSAKADTKADPATKSDLAKDAGAGDVGKKAAAKKAPKADTPDESKETKKAAKPKRAAASRQKECGAEWKADKAAGKIEQGMTWPKYWSACSKRKKGESA